MDHLRRHWNVFFFERGPRSALEPLAQLIALHGCDVVCLQEIDGGSWRNGYRNLVSELAALSGLSHYEFAPQRRTHCNDGIALLSRHPLRDLEVTPLVYDFERRGLIRARVEIAGQSFWVAVTHLAALGFNQPLRRRQAEHIARELAQADPLLLAADFNCEPDSAELEPLLRGLALRPLTHEPSFPSYRPRLRLDNVFATKNLAALETRVLPAQLSDHLPVLVRVGLS